MPRLRRELGEPKLPRLRPREVMRLDLELALPEPLMSVEYCVQAHLSAPDAPVHYVENGLINSLFGLLCWDAIFAPLPGTFFHPFQRGPANLRSEDSTSAARHCSPRVSSDCRMIGTRPSFASAHGSMGHSIALRISWNLLR